MWNIYIMAAQHKDPNKILLEYATLCTNSRSLGDELEVVFGSKNPLTRIEFENVISKLKSVGFTSININGEYHLNIQNQFIDKNGRTTIGNIRTTINGISNIKDYCLKNSFDLDKPPHFVQFVQKTGKVHQNVRLDPIAYNDFGFRITYKQEKILKQEFGIVQNLLQTWNNQKKVFRLIKRFTFTNARFPHIKVDCSVVRGSKKVGRRLIPEYRIETSDVFNNPETYEIEIEVDKKYTTPGTNVPDLVKEIRTAIKYVLSGIQQTNFPVSFSEQNKALDEYMHILYKNPPDRRVRTRDFVGPSSISLERPNIAPIESDVLVPNIRGNYTVTEKADGVRKLLFINSKGKVYLIDVNMQVQFTGTISKNKQIFNTILDGEHVLHNKYGAFINNYLPFDIYYVNKSDHRAEPFYAVKDGDESKHGHDSVNRIGRLVLLNKVVKELNLTPVVGDTIPILIKVKNFHVSSNAQEMFANCAQILQREKDELFEYETDGLIFTPADKGVGSDTVGEVLDPVKRTWEWSFKWKPPEFNTIDFLVTTQKSDAGEDIVRNIFQSGDDMSAVDNLTQYKTLILRVGFDERRHGYLNPCEDVIQDRLPRRTRQEDNSSYKPVPFYPTNPTPKFPAYICNALLENKGTTNVLLTENKQQVIEDETIVEFKYDPNREKFWQWVPIRVRLDKTADYRSNGRNFGNAYHVAQSVWNSIHNPVTEEMLTTGNGIPDVIADDDVYYNKKTKGTITRSLRDFHNLYVKRALILAASQRGGTLIDMTAGKGGDFPKWIAAKLSFVFGLDISRDNIENRLDGACARFLNYRKQFRTMPYALFFFLMIRRPPRSTQACYTDKGKQITRAVFGDGPRDEKLLGKGVFRQYGKAADGFDVVSNQFSIHYFFENDQTLNSFLRNVSECCKVGGYFIGTSYDGREVFRQLEDKEEGESLFVTQNGIKMWEIKKQYSSDSFNNDISCLGYKIEVYQESINKAFAEYLVNYEYLTRLLSNYGFALLKKNEAQELGLPDSIGNFDQLYYEMMGQIKSRRIRKSDLGTADQMSADEKRISFLNKYFIFKKIRDVNAEQVSRTLTETSPMQYEEATQETSKLSKVIDEPVAKPKVKKLGKRLKLRKAKKKSTTQEGKVEIPVAPPPGIQKPKLKIKSKLKLKKGMKLKLKKKENKK